MVLLKTAPDPDSEREQNARMLPYQRRWVEDGSRMKLWEKSFRIGATWADAFLNVRKRLHHAKRDYLFATKDYPSALEYMEACRQFCEMYNLAANAIKMGEEYWKVPLHKDGKATGFTEEIKVGVIKFKNGSRILAFSANPNAMLVYGGDVGLDEFPRHERPEELWAVAQARATWGFDLAVWGSHKGNTSLFYQFSREARAGKGGWSHHLTTIVDAVDDGLVEKINEVRGTSFTREGFLEDCRKRAKLPGVFEEAYMCNPQGGVANIVTWPVIMGNLQAYDICRAHAGQEMVQQLFGPYQRETEVRRENAIASWMMQCFGELLEQPRKHALGFDVAATGNGDLGAMYVDSVESGDRLQLRALLTTQTEDWHFMECACRWFMKRLPAIVGMGDETGLGKAICWQMAAEFPGLFSGANFASLKPELGSLLMDQLTVHGKIMPDGADHQDIAHDVFAIQKSHTGKKVVFSETANEFNDASHCDIAWAAALSSMARKMNSGAGGLQSVPVNRRNGRTEGLL